METFLTVSVIGIWVFLAILLVVMFFTLKLIVEFLNRYPVGQTGPVEVAPVGLKAPLFHGVDQAGNLFALNERDDRHTLILFSQDGCQTCETIDAKLPSLSVDLNDLRIVVVKQFENPNAPKLPLHPFVSYLYSDEVLAKYGIKRAPSFALIDPFGFLIEKDSISNFKELDLRLLKIIRKTS